MLNRKFPIFLSTKQLLAADIHQELYAVYSVSEGVSRSDIVDEQKFMINREVVVSDLV